MGILPGNIESQYALDPPCPLQKVYCFGVLGTLKTGEMNIRLRQYCTLVVLIHKVSVYQYPCALMKYLVHSSCGNVS